MSHVYWKIIRDRRSIEIAEGRLMPGEQRPTEVQLCRAFATGRHSVRPAVATLAAKGKLRVEQVRGTFVQSAPLIRYHIGGQTRFRQNLPDQGVNPAGEQLSDSIITAPAHVAAALALSAGRPVHRLLRRGPADGVPISLGLSYHCATRFPDPSARRAAGESVTDIYRSHAVADYLRRRTVLFTRRPQPEEATLLMQHPDQPVMVLQKTDVDADGQPFGWSEADWAGDHGQFSRDSPDDEGVPAPESGPRA